MAKYILFVFLVILIERVNCGRLAKCRNKGKMKKIGGIFLHFLDEFVIFQVQSAGISVLGNILINIVNVAMKHLVTATNIIVAFQRIQHVQGKAQM